MLLSTNSMIKPLSTGNQQEFDEFCICILSFFSWWIIYITVNVCQHIELIQSCNETIVLARQYRIKVKVLLDTTHAHFNFPWYIWHWRDIYRNRLKLTSITINILAMVNYDFCWRITLSCKWKSTCLRFVCSVDS